MRGRYPYALCIIGIVLLSIFIIGQYLPNTSQTKVSAARDTFEQIIKRVDHTIQLHVENEKPFQPMVFIPQRDKSFDYKKVMADMNSARVDQAEPRLADIIRNYYVEPPSLEPYSLTIPDRLEYSNGQTPFVDSRLNYIEDGFYIECGALNGEKGSNSFFFEKVRKWNGLLIEGDPSNYAMLKSKHRKALTMNSCLYPHTYPSEVSFNKAFNRGRAVHDDKVNKWINQQRLKSDLVKVQCFPLYSILLALNRTTVDFFSLDIEGDEFGVLQTIPFDKVNIKMLTVEVTHGTTGNNELQKFMESKGYDTLLKVSRGDLGVNDLIFRKKGLTH
ncbi:uncharacterized protein LOC110463698 [Mizuhopecten yessoensis]|uniref:Protein Star n=1 Tax=Mizuhopecten yessoensis TaxID=6573 RepID=A0A210PVG9_MIZYE|nr:uncharacterized protein LOC110463698 [Mizuhopecten yessoensis]XP_021374170.1 uncharacterized protein LOC110463698 [Mizuhopecten yessoensis]XP_021374171.1 uncharacterized protein LOC110463698 [Mizuhopecten yessoensis]XP_021374172.1 uncharacterized protein LOC110463698 [Mizuhopecten yessoensis]XP_021374173.1 uncharacterized protein LOC110463698 [Mizuhopecten yessoensis]XP_021374174.1 uncharacterized protein LOC110463698 [Mizuhopecten yessoensis]XP_021374175.1 uncharacterized protein LOC11046